MKVIDIHSHLLPGVDDGFQNVEDSLVALRRLHGEGVRDFIFTPHLNPDVYPDVREDRHREVYETFKGSIPPELGITTSLAAEYMIVSDFERRVSSRADELLAFPDSSVLVEMSYYFRSRNLEQTLFELNMAGLKPILAHPERYLYMSDRLSDFDRLQEMGCRFQMNALSLSGVYGKQSVKILDYLLERKMYSFVATDLHSLHQLDCILSFKPGFFLRRKLARAGLDFLCRSV